MAAPGIENGPSQLPWQAALVGTAELLQTVPRGQLDMEVLITLNRLLVPATNPYRGRVRDQRGFIWLDGLVQLELPDAHEAYRMASETLRDLDAAVASEAANSKPIATASEIAFRLMQAHPFMDGNGRVARAVAHWLLEAAGYRIISDPRKYCRERKVVYYQALAIKSGLPPYAYDPGPWNVFFTRLVAECYQCPVKLNARCIRA